MNRYDILLGKEVPLPEYNKTMIIGERRSGKTTVLLKEVKRSIEARLPTIMNPLLSVVGSQRNEIKNKLGKNYYNFCTVCTGFDEEIIERKWNLFLDNVEMYLEKLQFLTPEQNVIATCDEELFLQYYRYNAIPSGKILTINRMKWKLYRIDEVFKGDISLVIGKRNE